MYDEDFAPAESIEEEKEAEKKEDEESDGGEDVLIFYAVVAVSLGMSMVVVGTENLRQCVAEPMIPVYLTGTYTTINCR